MSNCQRCGNDSLFTTMSWFNTQMICMDCDKKEQAHPKFAEAKDTERAECMKGNTNFEGIGKPEEL